METVLHQINVHVILDGVVQHVINVQMDIIQMAVEVVYNVVIVIIMGYVQMDQVEQVNVHVIQVIQLLMVQLIIVLVVLMVMSWKIQFVSNVLKFVELVNLIQLIVLRIFSFIFFSFFFFFFQISNSSLYLDANLDIHYKYIITHVHQVVEMVLILIQVVVLVCFLQFCFEF